MFCYIVGEINYCDLFMNASANHSALGVGAACRCFTMHICWVEAVSWRALLARLHPKAALFWTKATFAKPRPRWTITPHFFGVWDAQRGPQTLPSALFLRTLALVQGYKEHTGGFSKGLFSVFDHFVFPGVSPQTLEPPVPLQNLLLPWNCTNLG